VTPTVVTCHDLDAFRCLLPDSPARRGIVFRRMARHILEGLQQADRVICVSEATRDELVAERLVEPQRIVVIANGVHPTCRPEADPRSDDEAATLLGPHGQTVDLLHVGSTVTRKRLDVLLRVFAEVRRAYPDARLVRVGGPFTPAQSRQVEELGLGSSVLVLPSLSRRVLAAVYRRATLLLQPSEREGFGLPVVEALASGLPVVASDLPVFREVGGSAIEYAPVADVRAWAGVIDGLLSEWRSDTDAWERRRAGGLARASRYSWAENARRTAEVYQEILA
jgi:glycosyltransferase involved in cell wall biosynthesis